MSIAMSASPPAPEIEQLFLNIAATCPGTRSLGPGLRAVVWVQGCCFHCPGCIAPEWIPLKPARIISPDLLSDELLENPDVSGLTFSGGEPMLQAVGLARLARLARQKREISIICFTGFQRQVLEKSPPVPGVYDLLDQIDVLIDGPYISRLNDNRGLRGSQNQKVHFITDRLSSTNFENSPRKADILIQNGQAMMVGVPPKGLDSAFQRAIEKGNELRWELRSYERI